MFYFMYYTWNFDATLTEPFYRVPRCDDLSNQIRIFFYIFAANFIAIVFEFFWLALFFFKNKKVTGCSVGMIEKS